MNFSSLAVIIAIVFPCCSAVNGYVSARLYKFFNGTHWIILSVMTCLGLSGFLICCLFVMNACEFIQTGRAVVSDFFILIVVWISFNVPIALVGTFFGFSQAKIKVATKVNKLPRK